MSKPTPALPVKSILLSKTFWVNCAAVLSLMVPAVKEWLEANPVDFLTAFAAVNVLVRFVTSGKVSVFPPEEVGTDRGPSGGMNLCVLGLGMATAVLIVPLSSCSPTQLAEMPLKVCATYHGVEVCASSK